MSVVETRFLRTTVVVRGSESGTGAATGAIPGRRGCLVLCHDRDFATATASAGNITAGGGDASACSADMTNRTPLEKAFGGTCASFGLIHGVLSRIGIQGELDTRSQDASPEALDAVSAGNLSGALAVSQVERYPTCSNNDADGAPRSRIMPWEKRQLKCGRRVEHEGGLRQYGESIMRRMAS